jgi:hypothetical protein
MPPKGKEEPVKKVLLGRPSNNVKMGIVGLPNVGKSTFFNLLCAMNVAAENYPFCTIDREYRLHARRAPRAASATASLGPPRLCVLAAHDRGQWQTAGSAAAP